ncbi:MAG: hypothetical protein RLZZ65_1772 [Bacteroidota bacterium]
MYADIGYNANPFSLQGSFNQQVDQLSFKNNFSPFLGLGFAYKWCHLRVGFPIIGNVRSAKKFGQTTQYNFAYDITYKKVWYDFEFKSTFGYALKDAANWDTTLTELQPHLILPKVRSMNFMLNGWYFHNPDFQMNGLLGKRAHYTKEILTWYLKGTVNYFGSANKTGPLIPTQVQDPLLPMMNLNKLQAFDFGVVPGVAYVNRKNNWQIGGWFGLGPVVQIKGYQTPVDSKLLLGLAPRFDFRLMGGYSSDERFFFLATDFDNKSIRYDAFNYRQLYYAVKFVAGYRFANHKKSKK